MIDECLHAADVLGCFWHIAGSDIVCAVQIGRGKGESIGARSMENTGTNSLNAQQMCRSDLCCSR